MTMSLTFPQRKLLRQIVNEPMTVFAGYKLDLEEDQIKCQHCLLDDEYEDDAMEGT